MTVRTLSRAEFVAVASEVVSRGGLIRCRVHGQCMRPRVADDDVVVLGPSPSSSLNVGNVVLARTARGPRLHRIVAVGQDEQGDWLQVRGDTQVGSGQRVRPADVVASLVRVERPLLRAAATYWAWWTRWLPALAVRAAAALRATV